MAISMVTKEIEQAINALLGYKNDHLEIEDEIIDMIISKLKKYRLVSDTLEVEQHKALKYKRLYEQRIDHIEEWIPVSERLPEKNKQVLIYMSGEPYIAWHDDEGWQTEEFTIDECLEPIAWHELPKQPVFYSPS